MARFNDDDWFDKLRQSTRGKVRTKDGQSVLEFENDGADYRIWKPRALNVRVLPGGGRFIHYKIDHVYKLRKDRHAYPAVYFNNSGQVVYSRLNIDETRFTLPNFKVHIRGGGTATYRDVIESKIEAAFTIPVSEIISRVVNSPVERLYFRQVIGDTISLLDYYVTRR